MSGPGPFLCGIDGGNFLAWCPGCEEMHVIAVGTPLGNGASWSFDGNFAAPTFSPSLLVRTGRAVDPNFVRENGDPPDVCHSFITGGHWNFCGDSTHALAGKVVPMVPWPEDA